MDRSAFNEKEKILPLQNQVRHGILKNFCFFFNFFSEKTRKTRGNAEDSGEDRGIPRRRPQLPSGVSGALSFWKPEISEAHQHGKQKAVKHMSLSYCSVFFAFEGEHAVTGNYDKSTLSEHRAASERKQKRWIALRAVSVLQNYYVYKIFIISVFSQVFSSLPEESQSVLRLCIDQRIL